MLMESHFEEKGTAIISLHGLEELFLYMLPPGGLQPALLDCRRLTTTPQNAFQYVKAL